MVDHRGKGRASGGRQGSLSHAPLTLTLTGEWRPLLPTPENNDKPNCFQSPLTDVCGVQTQTLWRSLRMKRVICRDASRSNWIFGSVIGRENTHLFVMPSISHSVSLARAAVEELSAAITTDMNTSFVFLLLLLL